MLRRRWPASIPQIAVVPALARLYADGKNNAGSTGVAFR
jgi:hypothetical protein